MVAGPLILTISAFSLLASDEGNMLGGGRRRGREEERDFLDNFNYSENILLIFSFILKVNLGILSS